jgi:uncharacterized membrane protein
MSRKQNLMRADRLGYVLGGIALIVWALRRPGVWRAGAGGLGGWLLYQAYTGSNPMFKPLGIRVNQHPADPDVAETIVLEEAITISRPRAAVFAFWQERAQLPAITDGDIEVTREAPPEELAWRAMRGPRMLHFGSLHFRDAPGARGTIVAARLEYQPAGGSLGAALAHVTGRAPQRIVTECLRRARAILEAGEAPTTAGQPSGRR